MKRKKIHNTMSKSNDAMVNTLQTLPIPTLVASMQIQLDILKSRGIEVLDFDNKSKGVKQIRMIGNKVYFLAAEGE